MFKNLKKIIDNLTDSFWERIISFEPTVADKRRYARRARRPRRKRRARQPPPKYPHNPTRRGFWKRRSLTPPPSPDRTPRSSYSQTKCILLTKLPYELRQMIFEECIGGMSFHLHQRVAGENRGLCYSAVRPPGLLTDLYKISSMYLLKDGEYLTLLALPLTSRQIYTETIGMLYSRNAFVISDMYILEYLPSLLLAQRISQIRSLSVNWELVDESPDNPPTKRVRGQDLASRQAAYTKIWQNLACMSGLRNLHVTFYGYRQQFNGRLDGPEMTQLLGPPKTVTTVDNYKIYFPFEFEKSPEFVSAGMPPWSDVPFEIGRAKYRFTQKENAYAESYNLPV